MTGTDIYASAPGKIVLCGEYVVLDGARALGAAVNRRVGVSITASLADSHVVRCPGYADGHYSFSVNDDGKFEWQRDAASLPDFSLLEETWRSLKPQLSTSIELMLDTSAFSDNATGNKFGLGSSAALTVALSAAIADLQQQSVHVDSMIDIHRRFQGGRGSGIDIAIAHQGGTISYRMDDMPRASPINWKAGLEYAIFWSGQSASTAQKLAQFAESDESAGSRQRLATASDAIVDAWAKGPVEQVVRLFDDYTTILAVFSDEHDLGIFDAGHAAMVEHAAGHGVVYKPCGAGGGDVGVALSASKTCIDDFIAAAAGMGFRQLPLCIDDTGLAVGNKE
jgi:phosphomevalonate kinase